MLRMAERAGWHRHPWRNGRGGIGILGTVATAIAIVLGYGMLLWMIRALIPASYPDMGVVLAID